MSVAHASSGGEVHLRDDAELIDQKSNSQVMLISIKKVTGGDANAMLIRFFHGVFLPPGVSVKVDGGQPTAIAFQKSDRLGVYAALPLTIAWWRT